MSVSAASTAVWAAQLITTHSPVIVAAIDDGSVMSSSFDPYPTAAPPLRATT